MASTVWESLTCANLFVAFAAVTGFAEKKQGRLSADYIFVVEVFWSDGRTTYVKRTYKDFLKFHRLLGFHFRTKTAASNGEKLWVPRLEGKRWFKRYTRNLAEYRELELHHFVKELLKVSPDVASENTVIEFFEPRPTDPVPCAREDTRFQPPSGVSKETGCDQTMVDPEPPVMSNGTDSAHSATNNEHHVRSTDRDCAYLEVNSEPPELGSDTHVINQ